MFHFKVFHITKGIYSGGVSEGHKITEPERKKYFGAH
jgi:hypothetical protein